MAVYGMALLAKYEKTGESEGGDEAYGSGPAGHSRRQSQARSGQARRAKAGSGGTAPGVAPARRSASLAFGADAADLDLVAEGAESLQGGNPVQIGFQGRVSHGFRPAAFQAGQMVMVAAVAVGEFDHSAPAGDYVLRDPQFPEQRQRPVYARPVELRGQPAQNRFKAGGIVFLQVSENGQPGTGNLVPRSM